MAFDVMDWLFGHSPELKKANKFTDQQQGFQQNLLQGMGQPIGSGLEYLQQILSGDPEALKAFEAPMMQQFEQDIIPGIAERFAGMGTAGAQDSSAFQQSLGRAGKELSTNLAAMKQGLMGQAMQQLQGLTGQGMQTGIENMYDPGSYGLVGGFLQGAGEGAGKAGMNYFLM